MALSDPSNASPESQEARARYNAALRRAEDRAREGATTKLDSLSNADLVALFNALAPVPVKRFQDRTQALKRTALALQVSGLSLNQGLHTANLGHLASPEPEPARVLVAPAPMLKRARAKKAETFTAFVAADHLKTAEDVTAYAEEQSSPEPEPEVVAKRVGRDRIVEDEDGFYAIVNGVAYGTWMTRGAAQAGLATEQARATAKGRVAPPKAAAGPRQPTEKQAAIIEACTKPSGATMKDLLARTGWPSINAPKVCGAIAERFGYDFEYAATKSRALPARYRMTARG